MRQSFAKSNLKLKKNTKLTKGENSIRSRCYFLSGYVAQRKHIPIEYEEDGDDDNFINNLPDIRLIENNNNTLPYADGNLPIPRVEEDWPIEFLEDDVDEVVDASLNMNYLLNGSIRSGQSTENLESNMNENLQSDTSLHAPSTTTSDIPCTVTSASATKKIITESLRKATSAPSSFATASTTFKSSVPNSVSNFIHFDSLSTSSTNDSQTSSSEHHMCRPSPLINLPTVDLRKRKYSNQISTTDPNSTGQSYAQMLQQPTLSDFSEVAPKKKEKILKNL